MNFLFVGNRRGRPSSWDTPAPPNLGIAVFRYRATDAHLELVNTVAPDISVGAMCIDAQRHVLYCTNETMTRPGQPQGGGGEVCAFAIDPINGHLSPLGRRSSFGSLPAYLALSPNGNHLIVVNHTGHTPITRVLRQPGGGFSIHRQYDDATTVLYSLDRDGSIAAPCDVHWHTGSGGPMPLQTHSQLHAVERSPCGRLFIVCDKGSDEISVFRIERDANRLQLCSGSPHRSVPGSSPRYCCFHPSQPYFYVNHETAPLISVYHYDDNGHIECVSEVPLCTAGETPPVHQMQSDLCMHPSGRALYDLVRGSNEIRVFEPIGNGGQLALVQVLALNGEGPRGCTVSPDGRHLLVAALVSRQVLVFSINEQGHLAAAGSAVNQPFPGTLSFFQPSPNKKAATESLQ